MALHMPLNGRQNFVMARHCYAGFVAPGQRPHRDAVNWNVADEVLCTRHGIAQAVLKQPDLHRCAAYCLF